MDSLAPVETLISQEDCHHDEEEEEEEEEEDVDFNPLLKETPSREASSSLSSDVEALDGEIVNSVSVVQNLDDVEKGREEEEIAMQTSVSCQEPIPQEDSNSEPAAQKEGDLVREESIEANENGDTIQTQKQVLISDEQDDAICKRTRARYSLESFTLDDLEAFLQETDDEDDIPNVDDEEEYRKFLAAVLHSGDADLQLANPDGNNDDDDEDNDLDFEIELEEALETDDEECIPEKVIRSDDDKPPKRRPVTRQKRRQNISFHHITNSSGQASRLLRPLLPILPVAPPARRFPATASSQDSPTYGFSQAQMGELHCLIHDHLQLLIQVYSLCALDHSRMHIGTQVQGLISEMHQRYISRQSHLLVAGSASSLLATVDLAGRYLIEVSSAVQDYRRCQVESGFDASSQRVPLFPLPHQEVGGEMVNSPPSAPSSISKSPSDQQQSKKTLAATLVESAKKESVALVHKDIAKLAKRFLPLFKVSLFPHKPPAAAVSNRFLFTDAEDELLALGIMEYNSDWKAIKHRFLPCKGENQICSKLSDKFGKHGLVKAAPTVRSLAMPVRMNDGMDDGPVKKKQPEPIDGPLFLERDKAKIERRKKKDDRQREVQYQQHVAEMEAVKAGMPTVSVNHDTGGGSAVRGIHMDNFNVSVGDRDLIVDGSITLSFGRHYGLVGGNGTGKTTSLRYMGMHAVVVIHCQILHVEQEVVGDNTTALQCVLNTDIERAQLLEEETQILAKQRELELGEFAAKDGMPTKDTVEGDLMSQRLEEIYKRLDAIDAYTAEARAASILADLVRQDFNERAVFVDELAQGLIGLRCPSVCRLILCLSLLSAWISGVVPTRQHDYEHKKSVLDVVLVIAVGLVVVPVIIYGFMRWTRAVDPQMPPLEEVDDPVVKPAPEDEEVVKPAPEVEEVVKSAPEVEEVEVVNGKLKKNKKKNNKKKEQREEKVIPAFEEEEEKKFPSPRKDNVDLEDEIDNFTHEDDWASIKKVSVSVMKTGTVAKGYFEERPVAVRCVVRSPEIDNEISILSIADGHQNILRYYYSEHKKNWSIYCLEPWICNLDELIQFSVKKSKSSEESSQLQVWKAEVANHNLWTTAGDPSTLLIKLIRDVVSGIEHLHEMQIIHRDLRPENVMIVNERNSLVAKIDDTGVAKHKDKTSLSLHSRDEKSQGWRAPELTSDETSAVDLFSLGVLIFYTVSKGKHPLVEEGDDCLVNLSEVAKFPEALHLINRLLDQVPKFRPSAGEVLMHPFFWSLDKKLCFLVEAGERLKDISNMRTELEQRTERALGGDTWGSKLDVKHVRYLENPGQRVTYIYGSLRDLVRLIRNTRSHYRGYPIYIKKVLGTCPDGVSTYFAAKFPNLLMEVYDVIHKHCKEEEEFKKFFKEA